MFSKLRDEEVINDEQCAHAQKLVCSMYGQKKLSSIAEARLEMFLKQYKPKIGKNPISCAKMMDGSSLPPCSPVILQKLRRTNYVCSVWLNAHEASPPKILNADGLFKMIVGLKPSISILKLKRYIFLYTLLTLLTPVLSFSFLIKRCFN